MIWNHRHFFSSYMETFAEISHVIRLITMNNSYYCYYNRNSSSISSSICSRKHEKFIVDEAICQTERSVYSAIRMMNAKWLESIFTHAEWVIVCGCYSYRSLSSGSHGACCYLNTKEGQCTNCMRCGEIVDISHE